MPEDELAIRVQPKFEKGWRLISVSGFERPIPVRKFKRSGFNDGGITLKDSKVIAPQVAEAIRLHQIPEQGGYIRVYFDNYLVPLYVRVTLMLAVELPFLKNGEYGRTDNLSDIFGQPD